MSVSYLCSYCSIITNLLPLYIYTFWFSSLIVEVTQDGNVVSVTPEPLYLQELHSTLSITKKNMQEILLCYRQLFIKGNVFIGEWGIFGAEVFLCYSQFFVKGDFIIGGVECK